MRGAAGLAMVLALALAGAAPHARAGDPTVSTSDIYRALLNGAAVLSPRSEERRQLTEAVRRFAPVLSDPEQVPPRAARDLVRIWSEWTTSGQASFHLARDPLSHWVARELFSGTSLRRYVPKPRVPDRLRIDNRKLPQFVYPRNGWIDHERARYRLWFDGNRYLAQRVPEGETLYLRPD